MKKLKLKERKISELIASQYNPRTITPELLIDLRNSIKEFGLIEPIIININKKRKNIIISGHQRIKTCLTLDMKTVPCIEVDLNLKKEKELNIRMNKNGGRFDKDLLTQYFNYDDLIKYGFESYEIEEEEEVDLEEFFENNNDNIKKDKNIIYLEYEDDEYKKVIDKLAELEGTKEQIIFKLLGL
tara:strand:- start:1498 stop:2052 length:555 start_codon:yes stop_codon:yes gene_type:complete